MTQGSVCAGSRSVRRPERSTGRSGINSVGGSVRGRSEQGRREQRLREALKARTEERYIKEDPAARLTLGELCKWYLDLPEVKVKDSYVRDKEFVGHFKRLLGQDLKLKDLTLGRVESYQTERLSEPFAASSRKNIRPASVNKEVSALKTILNRAVRHGKLSTTLSNGRRSSRRTTSASAS